MEEESTTEENFAHRKYEIVSNTATRITKNGFTYNCCKNSRKEISQRKASSLYVWTLETQGGEYIQLVCKLPNRENKLMDDC